MIFSLQTYLEDYFNRRGLGDVDQYAVALSKLYDRERHHTAQQAFLAAMKRIRTVFYKRNDHIQREPFERQMLGLLDNKFKKKTIPRPKGGRSRKS
jgi:hypothetical protein